MYLAADFSPLISRFYFLTFTMGTVGVVAGILIGLYILRKFRERSWGRCVSTRKLTNKVIIITGANSGIGRETARDLASRGAIVIMACRNREFAQEAIRDIRTSTGDGELIFLELDLGDLMSVHSFASNVLKKFDRIDALVNNAGVFEPPAEGHRTKDGYELHFGVNHLGHFLLTQLLLERIQQTPASRIVIVSSMLYQKGQIDFDNLNAENGWDVKVRPNALYNNSKLANILHARELQKRLHGTGVSVFCLCPGLVYTGLIQRNLNKYNFLKKLFFSPIAFLYMRTPWQGAQTSIHCVISEELDGVDWGFFRDCQLMPLEERITREESVGGRLWMESERLVLLSGGNGGSDGNL